MQYHKNIVCNEQQQQLAEKSIDRMIKMLEKELQAINDELNKLIQANAQYAK